MGEASANWRGGVAIYKNARGPACERCGSVKFLLVHHRDHDRLNNKIENLETLCKRCHQRHHKAPYPPTGAALIAILRPRNCKWCGAGFQPGGPRQHYCTPRHTRDAYNHRQRAK